jgi:acyl carrier protein
MKDTDDVRHRVKQCLTAALELNCAPESIADDAMLFAPPEAGGVNLDSLGALEVLVAIDEAFGLMTTDVEPEVFATVSSLADFVVERIQAGQA